ncbi:MAG: hypothetical protein OZ921_10580 [Sorangiineae bacterium]|nr:hypothetical protein [Polyangiaceae bacterium]MEB2322953.1 hypothetical protein [Sorangiineae bacterium]
MTTRRALGALAFGIFAWALPLGCSNGGSSDSGAPACTPGEQKACACGGGVEGFQVCSDNGASYGACQGCGDAGSSSGGSGSGSGGAGSGDAGGAPSSGGTGGGSSDASADGPRSCAPSEVSNVTTGECSLAAQDCPSGLTCGIASGDGGGWRTECQTLGRGGKALGDSCGSHGECAPGLRCVLAKCSRPCCGADESTLCGAQGRCNMTVSYDDGAASMTVCTFPVACTPWEHGCPASGPETDCHYDGREFACSFPNYDADGGTTEGKPCKFLNDCMDSQFCWGDSAGAACRWLCKLSDAGAPSAGTVGGAPGLGGCPSGQTCTAVGTPAWLGVCTP